MDKKPNPINRKTINKTNNNSNHPTIKKSQPTKTRQIKTPTNNTQHNPTPQKHSLLLPTSTPF